MAQKKTASRKAAPRKAEKTASKKTGKGAVRTPAKAVSKKVSTPPRVAVKKSGPGKKASAGTPAASARKPASAVAKKTAPKQPVVKEIAAKKPAAKKTAVKKRAAKASMPAKQPVPARKTAAPKAPDREQKASSTRPAKGRRLSSRDMETYRRLLLDLRDRVVDGISFLAGENLNNNTREQSGDLSNYGMHMADHGTDSFDRELALSMVSNEQDLIYEIDEALSRIESGTYGICEMTGEPIERERLRIIPYARFCVKAQEEMERGRSRFRPFGTSFVRSGPEPS